MRRATVHLLTLIVALAAGRAAADGLSIDGPEAVAPYRIVRLKAAGVPDKAGVIWRVRPVVGTSVVDWASRQNTKAVEWVAPPGQYRVELTAATVAADGTVSLDYAERVVTIGIPPSPPPGPTPPDPGPGPTPGPVPVSGPLYLVIVEETAEAAASRGALLADATVAAHVKAKGHRWRIVDQHVRGVDGQPPADVRPYLDLARGKALPQAYFVTGQGRLVWGGDLPTTPVAFLDLLKQKGG